MGKAKKSKLKTRSKRGSGGGGGAKEEVKVLSKKRKTSFKTSGKKKGTKRQATSRKTGKTRSHGGSSKTEEFQASEGGEPVFAGKRKVSSGGGAGTKKLRLESSKDEPLKKAANGGGNKRVTKPSGSSKKAGSDRAVKKARLIRRKCRKGDGCGYELVRESKLIWEHLRQHDNVPSRTLALEEIMAMAQGHFKELALKHDTARVVQSCLKFGSAEHRSCILAELKDHIVDLCKLKYASFVVKSLLRYSTAEGRRQVISSLYGHVRKFIRRSEASDIVEFAYNEYANLEQRTALVQEFYGSEFAVFKSDITSPSSQPVTQDVLGHVLGQHPDKSAHILARMRDSLLPLVDKEVMRHSIVHRALLDYMKHCSVEARSELIECVRERLPHILHTKDGSRLAMHCLWHGTAKDRKVIMKSLKGLVCKVCEEENGHLVFMALLDCVDDTVLVKKVILSELISGLDKVCSSHYGRRVLLYLLVPRSSRHFTAQFVEILAAGDGNVHSKKPADVRRKEVLEGVAPALLSLATNNVVEWVQSKCHALLLLEILHSLPGDLSTLNQMLLDALCGEGGVALMNDVHTDWVLGRLLLREKSCDQGFIHDLLASASEECIRSWVQGSYRAAYLLSRVLEGAEANWSDLKAKVQRSLVPVSAELAASSDKAHHTICKKLS